MVIIVFNLFVFMTKAKNQIFNLKSNSELEDNRFEIVIEHRIMWTRSVLSNATVVHNTGFVLQVKSQVNKLDRASGREKEGESENTKIL